GQTVTEVNRDANGVTLIDSAHKSHQAANAEMLTEDMLGWPLPLSGLSYWVTGQAQPGMAFQVDRDADQRPKLLTQNGWQINYTGWQDVAGQSLPHKLSLQREGLQIRLVADEWVLPAP
ncbi:MAG TPA: outer membrane lipoprotein LolB, partial [Betaproteobacteria bacterium]|nr:outer membrane lipoprotein LolB [Betaproteobacteria bacterium]